MNILSLIQINNIMKYLIQNTKGVYYIYESSMSQLYEGMEFPLNGEIMKIVQKDLKEIATSFLSKVRFAEPDDDVMSTDEFLEAVESGCFTDDDGHGYASVDGKQYYREHSIDASSAAFFFEERSEFNYVIWFNK